MSFAAKTVSKIKRVAIEQIAGSFMSGLAAGKIKGNYILMYHGVTSTGSTQFNRRHASIGCFRKQINFIKKHYSVVSLNDFFENKFVPGKTNLAITFDDGYLNNYTYAKPVLEEFKCPATFFITGMNEIGDNILWADYVNIASNLTDADIEIDNELFRKKGNSYFSAQNGKSLYEIIKFQKADYGYKQRVKEQFAKHVNFQNDTSIQEYWQLMTDRQITEASRSPYITIGSHGYYHNNLGTIAQQKAIEELHLSKKYLEQLVHYEIRQLAYPDGSYTPSLVKAASELGFRIQLAADNFHFNEQPDNPYIKKRHGIYSVDSCINQLFSAINTPY